ncbi:MAG TPA: AAA family ATPase [Chloroflexota bacterium]|nr:AAA family ATPase [Chloroflexota bacterium]
MVVIEKFTGFFARHWRALLVWLVLLAAFFFWFIPNAETAMPYVLYGAYLLFQLMFAVMFMIIQFAALFWFLGRGRTYWVMPGETGITFKDYRGQKDVLEVATRWVTLLRGVKEFKRMGGEVSRGLLLVGPPGTGKSYLAQAIATEAGVPFGYTSAASFRAMFIGMDVMIVWNLYRKARKLAEKHGACILFLDEIDAIGASRGGMGGGMGMMGGLMGGSGALNQLLMEMDPPRLNEGWKKRMLRRLGLHKKPAVRPNVVTMAATNIVNVLDAALLRAGRFDRKLTIDKPDEEGRKDVIEYYLAKVRHEDMPLDRMSSDTIGYTPVEIKYVINEATVVAHFNGHDAVSYMDFTEAREAHEFGIKQPIRGMKLEEKRRLAYHEAGHAFAMAMLSRETFRISKATILRQGGTLAMVAYKPAEERVTQTREELLADIQVSLASRAAEELFLNTQMNGFSGDLQHATWAAQAYLGIFGMGGSMYSYLGFGNSLTGMPDKRRVEELLGDLYQRVKTLLSLHAETVHAIAQALIANGELIGDDVLRIVDEKERERQSQDVIGREDTRRLAFNEAGKAVAEALLVPRREVQRVSIVSSAELDSVNELRPLIEFQTYSREEVLAEIKIRLASRASEELFLDTVLDKSAGDIKRARELARYVISYMNPGDALFVPDTEMEVESNGHATMVSRLTPAPAGEGTGDPQPPEPAPPGPMNPLAQMSVVSESGDRPARVRMDERTRREVDGLLREQYDSVKALLLENQVEVNRLARALAEKGELEAEDVRRLLNGKLPPRTMDAVMSPEPPPVEAMIPATAPSTNFE